MIFSMLLMLSAAYFTAFYLFDFFAEIFGGWALGLWLGVIATAAIVAFVIRNKIWHIKFSASFSLLTAYSFVAGFTFSPSFLGYSLQTNLQVFLPSILMFALTGFYAWIKDDENFPVMLISGLIFSILAKIFLGTSWASCFMAFVGCLIMIFFTARNLENAHKINSPEKWALSVWLGIIMLLAFWVLIWGAWDTTKRRYSRKR